MNFKEELKDIKVNGEIIDVTRMSSAYILLLLSYLRVNMNRNPDKPLCCYRLYQKITADIKRKMINMDFLLRQKYLLIVGIL